MKRLRARVVTSTMLLVLVASPLTGAEASTTTVGAWKVLATPNFVTDLSTLSCASTTDCWAAGTSVTGSTVLLGTTNGGSSWIKETSAGSSQGRIQLVFMACPSALVCYAVGSTLASSSAVNGPSGAILATKNGGSTWSTENLPSNTGPLDAVSCLSATHCFAVGETYGSPGITPLMLATSNAGVSWTNENARLSFQPGDLLVGIACVGASSTCTVTGANETSASPILVTSTNGGDSWSALSAPAGVTALGPPTCSTQTVCLIPGIAGAAAATPLVIATTNAGSSWQSEPLPAGISALTLLTCASATDCFMVASGSTGNQSPILMTTTNAGASWSAAPLPASVASLDAMVCPSSCIAVGRTTASLGAVVANTLISSGKLTIETANAAPNLVVGEPYSETLSALGGDPPYQWSLLSGSLPAGLSISKSGEITGTPTSESRSKATVEVVDAALTPHSATATIQFSVSAKASSASGIWALLANGTVHASGSATRLGSATPGHDRAVGITAASDGKGYEIVLSDGHFVRFGSAPDCRPLKGLAQPVQALSLEGSGCLVLTSTGRVLTSGGAKPYGYVSGRGGTVRATALTMTPDHHGYWISTATGGVFAFGDARFYGSAIHRRLASPAVALTATTDGKGYWLTTASGRVFAFGDAHLYRAVVHQRLSAPVVALTTTADERGYWLIESDGRSERYGDAYPLPNLRGAGSGSIVSVASISP